MKKSILCLLTLFTYGLAVAQMSVPGRLLVQHRIGSDSAATSRLFRAHGAIERSRLDALRVSVLTVDPARRDQIQKALEESGLFEFVEPDYLAHVANTPNDPLYTNQWHLPQIEAPSAWNFTTGSTSVPIAMIDSGVDPTHPDLAPKISGGWNFLTNSATITDTMGHGTQTAGTAAAIGNNGIGVAGVSWLSPIMPLIVVDSTGYASYSNIASAITYAAQHGVRIVNISIGGTSSSSVMQSAITNAWNMGTVVFASAGNGGMNAPYYPAGCQYAVAVGATDSNNAWQSFSNYGTFLSVVAPGVNIYTTAYGGGYTSDSGTSFSSPIAAGVGALMLSESPGLSAATLVSMLESTATDLGTPGYDQYYGWGLVNAYAAVNAVAGMGTSPTVSISTPTSGASVNGIVSVAGSASAASGISEVQLLVDGNVAGTSYASPFSFSWNSTTAANGSHTLMVKAYNSANATGSASAAVTVNNPIVADTTPPTVNITSPANNGTVGNGNATVTAAAFDNVGVTEVSIYVDGVLDYSGSVAPYSFKLNGKKLAVGKHTIYAHAWDAAGNMGTSPTITITASK